MGMVELQGEACFSDAVRRNANEFIQAARQDSLALEAKKLWNAPAAPNETMLSILPALTAGMYVAHLIERSPTFRTRAAPSALTAPWTCGQAARMGMSHLRLSIKRYLKPSSGLTRYIPRSESLQPLLSLQENWDGYGSQRLTEDAVRRADAALQEGSRHRIGVPDVAPASGGGVFLEWEVAGRDLELDILPDGHIQFVRTYPDGAMEEDKDLPPDELPSLFRWLAGEPDPERHGLHNR